MMGCVDPATIRGLRIRRARERRRWSQQRLADELGVGIRTVGRWERGEAEPRNAIGALDDVLGLNLDDSPPVDPREQELRDVLTGVVPEKEIGQWIARYRAQRDRRRAG